RNAGHRQRLVWLSGASGGALNLRRSAQPSNVNPRQRSTALRASVFVRDGVPLVLLAYALVHFDSWFTLLGDEALALGGAAAPLRQMLSGLWYGAGANLHPPLFDLVLWLW